MPTPLIPDSSPQAPGSPLPRVLLLGWEYAPRLTGGLGTASVRLAHALAERVALSVIVPRLPSAPAADEATNEPALSELAAAPDGPDALRHFPASADWRPASGRRPQPVAPLSAAAADSAGAAPASPSLSPGTGQALRLTALSQLTPAAVRAATVAPPPPRYEVFARQVHRIALAVLPYAEPAAAESAELTEGTVESPDSPLESPGRSGELPDSPLESPESALESPESSLESPDSPPALLRSTLDSWEEPAAGAATLPDPLAEALAPFQHPVSDPRHLPSSNTEVVQFARLAARVASGDDVDVVYAHDWPTFLAGVEIRLEKKVPLVLHVHSTSYDRHGPPVQGWVFELERAAFRAADRVVAVSAYCAQVLREHYGVPAERLHVVHHGLTAGPLGPQWEARPVGPTPTVLFVGRLTSQKNPLGFVEIARLVAAQLPGVRFAVAGDGPQRAAVQAAADAAGLDETQFELLGFLNDADVSAALAAAAVVCLPARSEPFGLSALEAAAAGVPVVLSTTTGAAEVLPGALTAPFDDAAAFAAHILTLLREEATRRRAVRENAAAARRLTWERAATEVLAVLLTA